MTQVTNTVRFVLDGRIVEAQGERRTTTVLDYLREQLHRTGTKEGCAEGDCGACVVMVGELNAAGTGVNYVPVNACIQLLPSLDGKSVKTVESLKKADGTLHPVQDEMVKCHGSQCGFCTPGIVMSLVNLVQVLPQPSRQQITDSLSGNLCRCTGYKPIIDAAAKACERKTELKVDDQADLPLLKEIQRAKSPTLSLDGDIIVQPVVRTRKGNEFVSPATLAEVAHYLVEHPRATLLAGSTEIGLQVNKQFSRPEHIVYLGLVPELQRIDATAQGWRIGAAVSLERVLTLVAPVYPDFAEVLRRFGSPPIRSTATLAGNIANGSPIGDSMPCLMALGATLVLRRGNKTRQLALDQFYTGQKNQPVAARRVHRGHRVAQAGRGAGVSRAQGQQALRAGYFSHLLGHHLPPARRQVVGRETGLQRPGPGAVPCAQARGRAGRENACRCAGGRPGCGHCGQLHRTGWIARYLGLSLAGGSQPGA